MNKKILLSTFVVSGLLATSFLAPKTMAAKIVDVNAGIATTISHREKSNDYIMSVVLPNKKSEGSNTLTRAKLVNLLEKKYKKGIVKEVKKGKKTLSKTSDKVGTGCTVTLTTGRKMTVILYGDVTGDGVVNLFDTVSIAKHNVGMSKITNKNKLRAGELTGKKIDEKLKLQDTTRVAFYNVGLVGKSTKYGKRIVDEALYPAGLVEQVNSDKILNEAIKSLNKNEKNSGKFEIILDAGKNEAEFKFLTEQTEKISNFAESGLVETLVAKLKEYSENLEKIELTFNINGSGSAKTVTLTSTSTEQECIEAAVNLLGGTSTATNKTIKDLFGKTLTAKFYLLDTSKLTGGEQGTTDNGKTYVEYKLKFVSGVNTDAQVLSAMDAVNKNEKNTNLFKIDLDPKTNSGTFGFLDNSKTMTDFVGAGTGLIEELNKVLKDERLDRIELSVTQSPAALSKQARQVEEGCTGTMTLKKDSNDILSNAKKLMNYALGCQDSELMKKTVLDLAGAELTAKVYLAQGVEAVEGEEVKSADSNTNTYVEYKLKFLVNADEELQVIFNSLNNHKGNDIYRVEFTDKANGNINFNIGKEYHNKTLQELYGKGNTGLVTAAEKLLTNLTGDNQLEEVTATLDGKTYELRKGKTGQAKNVAELINALLGAEVIKIQDDMEHTNWQVEKLNNIKLSVLKGKTVDIEIQLTDKAVQESNWNKTKKLTVHFNLVDSTFTAAN